MNRQATDDKPASPSVFVVLGYAAGEEKSWEDLRRALRAGLAKTGESVRAMNRTLAHRVFASGSRACDVMMGRMKARLSVRKSRWS
jgi:CRISPR/Cas system endoribonuclease Cas6 (RAMP superfamily)